MRLRRLIPARLHNFLREPKVLNGIAALSNKVLVAADSFGCCIWRIDVQVDENGTPTDARITEWLRDPLLDGQLVLPDFQPGVNGLKYSQASNAICFTNTQQRIFRVIPVDTQAYAPADRPTILITGPQGDDLILDDHYGSEPVAYVTTHRDNSILRIPLRLESTTGSRTYETVAEPTQHDSQVLVPTAGA